MCHVEDKLEQGRGAFGGPDEVGHGTVPGGQRKAGKDLRKEVGKAIGQIKPVS